MSAAFFLEKYCVKPAVDAKNPTCFYSDAQFLYSVYCSWSRLEAKTPPVDKWAFVQAICEFNPQAEIVVTRFGKEIRGIRFEKSWPPRWKKAFTV